MSKNIVDEMLTIFNNEFPENKPIIQTWVNYEVLLQQIEYAIDNTPNDTLLGGEIRQIISNWTKQNKDILKAPKNKKKTKRV